MPATLHIYVLLHVYGRQHTEPALLHISVNNNKMLFLFSILLPYMSLWQICPSNATYMPLAQIIQCAPKRDVCQYICNIWTHQNKPHGEEFCTQTMMMPTLTMNMMQPNCITWVGNWQNQPNILAGWQCTDTNIQTESDDNLCFYGQRFGRVLSRLPHLPN